LASLNELVRHADSRGLGRGAARDELERRGYTERGYQDWTRPRKKAAPYPGRKKPVARKRAAPKRKAAGKWSVEKDGRTYSVYRGSDLYKTGLPKIAADAIVKAKTQLGQ
jgi:hypothetical protein